MTATRLPDLSPVNRAVRRSTAEQKTVYHCKSFKSVQELKSAIATAWQLPQAFFDRTIGEWQRNSVAFKMKHSVMADTWDTFVKEV